MVPILTQFVEGFVHLRCLPVKIVKIKIYVNIGNAFDDKSSIINRAENNKL